MRIAVNARHLMRGRLEGIGTVTHEVMKRIVNAHPEDRYDYYFDRPYDAEFIHGPNVMPHVCSPPARLPILIRYWNKYPVALDVKIRKSDVYYSPDGFVPLNLNIPKVSVVHDAAFFRFPQYFIPRIREFYRKWMPLYLEKTDHIITVSQFSKDELIDAYQIDADKISVVHNGVSSAYLPIPLDQVQAFRDQHTQGKPYIFYLGSIHPRKNVVTLIRAFEQFRESYPNEVKLVLAGRVSWDGEDVLKAVHASKWKEEILMPGFIDRQTSQGWMASALAMVYPSLYEGFGLPLLESMSAGVPVISSNSSSLPEVGGNAALYFEPKDVLKLAEHLFHIYTDQQLRNQLIRWGTERINHFSWDQAAAKTYKILSSVSNNR